ncbi:MAG: ABC transporter substrate-binding protein [Acidobacteria bacterium]|nr:ABC transporter substrate-binding protein [Acidobacteriota bacterium]
MKQPRNLLVRILCICFAAALMVASVPCPANGQQPDVIPLTVELLNRSINKLPFVIAEDRGLYKKYGLDVKLWMPNVDDEWGMPDAKGGVNVQVERPESPDISVDGGTPMMASILTNARAHLRIMLATTDCVVRWHIVARRGIRSLEELKGKRLGISGPGAMTDFISRLLAQKMGWNRERDISVMSNAFRHDALDEGLVDAFVAYEVPYAAARQAGYQPLFDTRDWNASIAGSSVRVEREWLKIPRNREAARRFLKATAEAISIFHQDRAAVLQVLSKWHGMQDREFAGMLYLSGKEMPRKPFPCVEGIKKTLELWDGNEARKYKPEDFYDDSLMKELDESGFLDGLYQQ